MESPTKAKTLAKFLGSDYQIEASYGHVRDLPQKKLGIKISNDKFVPDYVQTKKQKDRTDEIKKLVPKSKFIYLATDPDREGEAIAWHIGEVLRAQKKVLRVAFHEITKSAIEESLKHPRGIDMQLVDAQQARRILDRLVGYKLSPLLWKKIRKGLSAGRVQSVALRLIVEREREIEAFKPEEYWQILVDLQKVQGSNLPAGRQGFKVQLIADIKNQVEAEKIERELRIAKYQVESVEKKDFSRTPPAPFTTSTLQQAAANRLGWSAKKTMQVAQGLYEEGLITYHRTDSTNLAIEAVSAAAQYITKTFGANYALAKPRFYKTKSKVAQEAHEAIRPTDLALQEVLLQSKGTSLNKDQERLYELIWKRFVACQMAEVTGETTKITVTAGEYKLEARGETVRFDGWYKVLGKDAEENILPEVAEGEKLSFVDLQSLQKFSQPPARYNDASLIKTQEEKGIGRPSTYAPIISTILERLYVEKMDLPAGRQGKRFQPTALGIAVCDFLVTNFADIVDYDFTAKMEDELDEIADGKREWEPTIAEFYAPFSEKLEKVTETAQRVKVEVEETGNLCPKCGQGKEIIRLGKFGKFLACSRFPECDYKANYLNKTGQKCPKCATGDVILKRTKFKKTFFGCSNYPTCDFASWTKPKNG